MADDRKHQSARQAENPRAERTGYAERAQYAQYESDKGPERGSWPADGGGYAGLLARRAAAVPANVFASMDEVVAQERAAGFDVIDLSKANPDLPTPAYIVEAGRAATGRLENHRYTPFDGKPDFLQAAAGWYRREQGVDVDWTTELLATCGAIMGLSTVTQVLLDPGDTVVVPEPYYPPYAALAAVAGARMVTIPPDEEHGFIPALDAVDPQVWDDAKLLLLNYPNNPTGAAATRQFYEQVVRLAHRHHFLVMNDFAYAGIGTEALPLSLLAVDGARDVSIEVVSLSKMYGMAGWRAGFAAAPAELMAHIRDYHHQMCTNPAGAVQDAGAAGLNGDQSSVRELSQRYAHRRGILSQALSAAGIRSFDSAYGLFVWARVPDTFAGDGDAFARAILRRTHVAVMPGSCFGASGKDYIRLSLLESEDHLIEAAARIRGMAW